MTARMCLSCAQPLHPLARPSRLICDQCKDAAVRANLVKTIGDIDAPFLDFQYEADETDVLEGESDELYRGFNTSNEVELAILDAQATGDLQRVHLIPEPEPPPKPVAPFGTCRNCWKEFQPRRSTATLCKPCRDKVKNREWRARKLEAEPCCITGCKEPVTCLKLDQPYCEEHDKQRTHELAIQKRFRAAVAAVDTSNALAKNSVEQLYDLDYSTIWENYFQYNRLDEAATVMLFFSEQEDAKESPVVGVDSLTGDVIDTRWKPDLQNFPWLYPELVNPFTS